MYNEGSLVDSLIQAFMSTAGIYKITNTVNGRVYIGQSCNIENRLAAHRRYLVRGAHDNKRLQRAWLKYGPEAFRFEQLEAVNDNSILTDREQHWMDLLNASGHGGYNMCPAAGSCKGYRHTPESIEKRKGKKPWNKGLSGAYKTGPASDERKKKIGQAQAGSLNHNYGKTIPDFVKRKISASLAGSNCHLAKLNEDTVREIKIALANGACGADLARKHGVANAQISAIKTGKTWKHVKL